MTQQPNRFKLNKPKPKYEGGGVYASWYKSNRWIEGSKQYRLDNPFCEVCEINKSKITHHKIPHRGDYDLFWDVDNWQAICPSCHNKLHKKKGK